MSQGRSGASTLNWPSRSAGSQSDGDRVPRGLFRNHGAPFYPTPAVLLRMSDPAPDQRRDVRRPVAQQRFGRDLHARQQVRVAQQVGHAHLREPGLARAEQFAGSAQLQIAARHLEAVVGLRA